MLTSHRWRWAMALAIPVSIVVVLVFAYRLSAPGPSIAALSDRPVEGDVLTVGALPVT